MLKADKLNTFKIIAGEEIHSQKFIPKEEIISKMNFTYKDNNISEFILFHNMYLDYYCNLWDVVSS